MATIHTAASEHLYAGSNHSGGRDTIFDGIQVIAGSGAHVQVIQNGAAITNDFWNSVRFGTGIKGLNPDAANGIACRFYVQGADSAADIDGRRLLLQTREFGYTYTEFSSNGTTRGINVAALTYATDLTIRRQSGTVSGWSDVTNLTAGYNGIDVNADSTLEYYYAKWDRGSCSINQFSMSGRSTSPVEAKPPPCMDLQGSCSGASRTRLLVTTPRTSTIAEGAAASWSGGTAKSWRGTAQARRRSCGSSF